MDTKNLGNSVLLPYYFAVNKDKDFTITSRIFNHEHPLFLGEYRQAFKNSNLIVDAGYTEGYKKTSEKRKAETNLTFLQIFQRILLAKIILIIL